MAHRAVGTASRTDLALLDQTDGSGSMDMTGRDLYDVSVEDPDRREEVELTAQLIVAANDSTTTLNQTEIDRILGVSPRPRS